MKTLITVLLFTVFSYGQKVIVLDSTRKIVKFDVEKTKLTKTLDSLKGKKFYVITRKKGKEYECLYVRKGRRFSVLNSRLRFF